MDVSIGEVTARLDRESVPAAGGPAPNAAPPGRSVRELRAWREREALLAARVRAD